MPHKNSPQNKNRREIAVLKKEILKEMKSEEVLISEKYRLVFTKRKGKLIIKPLIIKERRINGQKEK